MFLNIGILLIIGFVTYSIQIGAEGRKTCPAHEEWTVFQRRTNGNVDFFRGWDDYVNGFGECDGDLWLGLESLHQATKRDDMSLEINMMSKGKNDHMWAKYRSFRIGPGSDNYRLHVSGYSGNVEDGLATINNEQFSTKDADHDGWRRLNCASYFEGGWWHDDICSWSNLNGNFNRTGLKGLRWWSGILGTPHALCYSEMKIYNRSAG